MKKILTITFSAILFALLPASGAILISDSFNYPNGALAGNGGWDRGTNSPTSDNPSNYITVENNAVKFDWTTTAPINNVVRHLWGSGAGDAQTSGSIYAIFDIRVTLAPQAAPDVRPGFLSFASSDGSQQRGFVGIQAGSTSDTFQLGVSANSQNGPAFEFAGDDLDLNTTYSVMIGHNIDTSTTSLWIGTTDTSLVPVAVKTEGTTTNIRRVNLRLYNSDGGAGTTDLGIFYLDNLTITTIPEPSTYAAIAGLMALALIIRRRIKK